MTKTLLNAIIPLIALCLMALPLEAGTQKLQNSKEYKDCTSLVSSKPAEALKKSQSWLAKEDSPAALHCRALARYSLKQYKDSASDLETLASRIGKKQERLYIGINHQAGTAYSLSKQNDKALALYAEAIALSSEKQNQDLLPSLLIDRASLYQGLGKHEQAIQDADHALTINNNHSEALVIRAKALRALSFTEEADLDLKHAVALDKKTKKKASAKATSKKKVAAKKSGKKSSAKATPKKKVAAKKSGKKSSAKKNTKAKNKKKAG